MIGLTASYQNLLSENVQAQFEILVVKRCLVVVVDYSFSRIFLMKSQFVDENCQIAMVIVIQGGSKQHISGGRV